MVAATLCLLALGYFPAPLQAESRFSPGDQTASLAVNLLTAGNLEGCESAARQALHSYDELLGPNHPHSALARRNVAAALWHLGKFNEAEIELLLARAALMQAEGEAGPGALRAALDLAGLYASMQRQSEAAAIYERAWHAAPAGELRREAAAGAARTLGSGHEGIIQSALDDARLSAGAETLLELDLLEGEIELKLLRPGKALKAFGSAHERGQKIHGAGHPFLAPSLEGMARGLKAAGQGAEAEPLFERALEGRRRMAGLLSYASLHEHEALGRLLADMGRNKEAKDVLKGVLALRKKMQPGHPAIKTLENVISRLKP